MKVKDFDWRLIFQTWTDKDLEYLEYVIIQVLESRKKYSRGLCVDEEIDEI